MAGKKSRDKGANFERDVARAFSEAYGMTFRRTPLSGGWAQDADVAAGDVVCVDDPEFEWCIECKKSEGWRLESLLTGDRAWFDNWWQQLLDECPDGKWPVLIFSRNRCPKFAAVEYDQGWSLLAPKIMVMYGDGLVIIVEFSQFLEWDTSNYVDR